MAFKIYSVNETITKIVGQTKHTHVQQLGSMWAQPK